LSLAKKGLSKFSSTLKSVFGVSLAVGVIGGATKRILSLADSVSTLSKTTGLGAETVQTLQHAVTMAGGKAEEANVSMEKFSTSVGRAMQGVAESVAVFTQLGVALLDTEGKVKSNEQILGEVADALKEIKNPSDRAYIATKLFGESGLEMALALSKGSDELQRMRRELEATGKILDSSAIRELDLLDKSIKDSTDTAEKSFGRFAGKFVQNLRIVHESIKGADFWAGLLGDGKAEERWKKSMDAILFGAVQLADAEQQRLITAKELAANKKAEAEATDRLFDNTQKLRKAESELQAARDKRTQFGSLESVAKLDLNKSANFARGQVARLGPEAKQALEREIALAGRAAILESQGRGALATEMLHRGGEVNPLLEKLGIDRFSLTELAMNKRRAQGAMAQEGLADQFAQHGFMQPGQSLLDNAARARAGLTLATPEVSDPLKAAKDQVMQLEFANQRLQKIVDQTAIKQTIVVPGTPAAGGNSGSGNGKTT
jgi:hypothetical protein